MFFIQHFDMFVHLELELLAVIFFWTHYIGIDDGVWYLSFKFISLLPNNIQMILIYKEKKRKKVISTCDPSCYRQQIYKNGTG